MLCGEKNWTRHDNSRVVATITDSDTGTRPSDIIVSHHVVICVIVSFEIYVDPPVLPSTMAALTVPGVAVFNSAAPGRTGAAKGLSNGHSEHRERGPYFV